MAIADLVSHAAEDPDILQMTSFFQGNTPQFALNIDRNKVEMQGLSLGDVFTTLSYYMGSVYVNDFNEFGKIYQVKMSAQASARSSVDDVLKLSVRNDRGEMVPFSSFTEIEEFMGLNLLTRYNLYS